MNAWCKRQASRSTDPHFYFLNISVLPAAPKWYGRHLLELFFGYPFEQLGCQMVITRNSEHNTRLHRQLKTYGFQCYPIPRGRGRDEAEMLWTLTEEQWRASPFMRKSNVQT